MADYNDITSATIAVVFQQDGLDDFYPCHSGIEIDQAQQEIRAAGGEPVVFYREGHFRQPVTNKAENVGGNVVQCERIDGGVRF